MKRSWVYITAAVLLASAVAVSRTHIHDPALDGPAPLPDEAGPRTVAVPQGATFAEDSASLETLLAEGPDEVWLRPHTYRGDFVVKRKLALRGMKGATLEGRGASTVLTVEADDAWIDNVAVRHSGRRHTVEDAGIKVRAARVRVSHVAIDDTLFGVIFAPCHGCVVEYARIHGMAEDPELRGDGIKLWESPNAVVRGCVMEDSRDLVVWYSRSVLLDGNTVRRSRYGSHFMYAHDATVRGSRIESNVVGIFVMYSDRLRLEGNVLAGARGAAGIGIGFKESDGVTAFGNWIVANTTGVYLDRTPLSPTTPVVFANNVLALNGVALRLHSSEDALTFRGNDFHQNVSLVEVEGGGDALGVTFAKNHWSEYEGYDLNHDGIGDVAFEVKQLSSELTGTHPALKFFDGTVAMGTIDAVARAVPVLASHRVLVDAQPLMEPTRRP